MPWWYLALSAAGGLALAVLLCLWTVRSLARREPYAGFVRLRARRKLTFFRLLLQDNRVPLHIKLLPIVAAVYLANPIDLLPGVILDDLALALLALVLILSLTPRQVVEDLLQRAQEGDAPPPPDGATPPPAPNVAGDP